MVEFPQSVPNLIEASTNLYELVKGGNPVVYPDEGLRLAVHRAVAIETSRGWRIAKEMQAHKIDVVVALAQAALGAVKQQAMAGAGWLEMYRRDHEAIVARQRAAAGGGAKPAGVASGAQAAASLLGPCDRR